MLTEKNFFTANTHIFIIACLSKMKSLNRVHVTTAEKSWDHWQGIISSVKVDTFSIFVDAEENEGSQN